VTKFGKKLFCSVFKAENSAVYTIQNVNVVKGKGFFKLRYFSG
jgi:hypothetical protein